MLWEPEVFPIAAALQLKRGAALYRDIWFDKPPLLAWIYTLWGTGVSLRIAGALYDLLACGLAWSLAATLWSRREAYLAAGLLAFYLTFDTHSAVVPLGADLMLLVPHLAALLFAVRKQAFLAGLSAGVGFLINAKAVFVFAACVPFLWPAIVPALAGFLAPCLVGLIALVATGSMHVWNDQALRWPALYARSPILEDPLRNGITRTANWLGFHITLVLGCIAFYLRRHGWRFAVWTAFAFFGVVLGWRFFPRYFFLLLPALIIPAAAGLVHLRQHLRYLALALLLIPAIRFGPRYFDVANTPDLAMDRDSRDSARVAKQLAPPHATLYVWGYRPELYAYTDMPAATRWIDSQALTGVPADRHLTQSTVVLTEGIAEARAELAASKPDIVIDGLTPFNPNLSMDHYPELRPWLAHYREAARTRGTIIYQRIP